MNRTIAMTVTQSVFDDANRRVAAGALTPGTSLRAPDGGLFDVESVERIQGHVEVATLTTDHDSHNFSDRQLVYGNSKYK